MTPSRDLDRLFEEVHGDIDQFIERNSYATCMWASVETYRQIETDAIGLLAVSSGFMTCPKTVHPQLRRITTMRRPTEVAEEIIKLLDRF